jgi:hypothetical protein
MGKLILDSSLELCLELIYRHKPFNYGEEQLIKAIANDILFAFGPGETIERAKNAPNDSTDYATFCIERIQMRTALNHGERQLLEAMINDLRIAFGIDGAVERVTLPRTSQVPEDWFWQ